MTSRRALASGLLVLSLLAIAVLGAWHYATLYQSLTGARAALAAIEGDLVGVGIDAELDDLERAEGRLTTAERDIARARRHLRWDPLLQAARIVPVAGDQVHAVRGLVEIGATAVELGREATALGRQVVEVRDQHGGAEPITGAAVAILGDSEPYLQRIEILTERLLAQRLALGDTPLLPPLHESRRRLDESLPRLVDAVDRASIRSRVLADLLGFEGERRYLVLSLNNAEILPGGGLVTVAGVMVVENGQAVDMDFGNTALWKPQWEILGGPYIEPPGPLRRYLMRDFSWNLGVSNWDPDFPTWAQHALEFYELAWSEQGVDGVIAVDLEVLLALLEITGPKTVEDPEHGAIHLTADNAVMELERVTRRPFDLEQDNKVVVGELKEQVLQSLLTLPPDRWPALVDAIRRLGEERHLQMLFFEPAAQTLVRDLGWDGRLLKPETDFLHFNEASVNSTKLNMVFEPSATYRIEITRLGTAHHRLELHYHNTFREWAEGKDPELVAHLMFEGQYGGYLRPFVPRGARNFAAEFDGAPAGIESRGSTDQHEWFGVFMPLPPDARRDVTLRWSVPQATLSASTYELYIQKQPGTRGLCIDLAVERDGQAARLDVIGGSQDDDGRYCLTSDMTVRATFE